MHRSSSDTPCHLPLLAEVAHSFAKKPIGAQERIRVFEEILLISLGFYGYAGS